MLETFNTALDLMWHVLHVLFSLYIFDDKYQIRWKNLQNCYLSETKRWNKKNNGE